MRPLFLPLLCLGLAIPVTASACGSLVTSVCVQEIEQVPARKVLRVKPSVTAFVVGDRFPFESRSFVMDPARYNLDKPQTTVTVRGKGADDLGPNTLRAAADKNGLAVQAGIDCEILGHGGLEQAGMVSIWRTGHRPARALEPAFAHNRGKCPF